MFLDIDGTQFTANGKPILLKGVGLGNWLNLEHFMLGIPGTETEIRSAVEAAYGAENARQFWRVYYRKCVDEADIQFFKELCFNCIRLPVNARLFQDADLFENSTAIREMDRVIELCAAAGIYAVIDLHAALVGQNPDWHSDNTSGIAGFFHDADVRTKTALLWKSIALYYKDNPYVGGYDLLNEPCYFDKTFDAVLVAFYRDCIEQIRSVDERHIIFLEGNTYARDFSMFDDNLDDRVAYTFHYYPFLQLPGQLQPAGLRDRLRDSLYKDVTLSHLEEKLRRPVWCGETGHPLHAPKDIHALQVFLRLLEEKHISWSLWPHKDARAMGLCYPKESSAYLSLVKAASNEWSFWDVFNQDSILSVQDTDDKAAFYRALAADASNANRIFRDALRTVPFEQFLDALDEFQFENCERNEPLIACLKESSR